MLRHWIILSIGAAWAAAVAAASCGPYDAEFEDGSPLLIVSPAERQPANLEPGTHVVLQQRNGKHLRIKTVPGTHTFTSDGPDTPGHELSCIPAPRDGEPFFFNVRPEEVECALFVELLGEADAAAGASDGGAGDACGGQVLKSALLPITTLRQSSAAGEGAGGSAGGGGASSTGGMNGTGGAGGGGTADAGGMSAGAGGQ